MSKVITYVFSRFVALNFWFIIVFSCSIRGQFPLALNPQTNNMVYSWATALNNCGNGGWGEDRMAIMMISQCYKTKNLALNQQALWKSISLFQLNKITFLDLSLTDAGLYMLTIEQLSVALRKQCNCHPIPPPPPSSIKNQWLCSSPMGLLLSLNWD